MPTYVFRCGECSQQFEVYATIREREAGIDPPCPKCGSRRAEQLLTAPMLLQRGAGRPDFRGCGPVAGPGCCG